MRIPLSRRRLLASVATVATPTSVQDFPFRPAEAATPTRLVIERRTLDGHPISGALRDTALMPVNSSVTVAFDANNPGRWLFHCHNLFHMATGTMTEIAYRDVA